MKKILGVIAVLILCFSCYIAIYKKTENSEERLENQNIIQAKMKEENNVVEVQEKVEVVENKSTEQEHQKEKIIEQKTNETKPKTQDKVKKTAETKKETKTAIHSMAEGIAPNQKYEIATRVGKYDKHLSIFYGKMLK